MTQVVIGNIIALIASILMVLSGLQKKKKILFIQSTRIDFKTLLYERHITFSKTIKQIKISI